MTTEIIFNVGDHLVSKRVKALGKAKNPTVYEIVRITIPFSEGYDYTYSLLNVKTGIKKTVEAKEVNKSLRLVNAMEKVIYND